MKLAAMAKKSKEAGRITSATRSERLGKEIALGYVKRGFNSVGTKLDAINPENPSIIARVEIVDLPFAC
jgi:glycine cleavage system aminomethyltransferase T